MLLIRKLRALRHVRASFYPLLCFLLISQHTFFASEGNQEFTLSIPRVSCLSLLCGAPTYDAAIKHDDRVVATILYGRGEVKLRSNTVEIGTKAVIEWEEGEVKLNSSIINKIIQDRQDSTNISFLELVFISINDENTDVLTEMGFSYTPGQRQSCFFKDVTI